MCPSLNINDLQQTHHKPAGTVFSPLQNKFTFPLQSNSI